MHTSVEDDPIIEFGEDIDPDAVQHPYEAAERVLDSAR
jgi:hypothetical protein